MGILMSLQQHAGYSTIVWTPGQTAATLVLSRVVFDKTLPLGYNDRNMA
jgi:hypothetical protein